MSHVAETGGLDDWDVRCLVGRHSEHGRMWLMCGDESAGGGDNGRF